MKTEKEKPVKKTIWRRIVENGAKALAIALPAAGCGYVGGGIGYITYDDDSALDREGAAIYEVRGGLRTPTKFEAGIDITYDRKTDENLDMIADNLRIGAEFSYPMFEIGPVKVGLASGLGNNRTNLTAGPLDGISDTLYSSLGLRGICKIPKGEAEVLVRKLLFHGQLSPEEALEVIARINARF